jgi:peptidylprolyl isomerase
VEQITALAREGAYDGVVFHRVIDGFMAQTGDVEFGRAGGDMRRAGMGGSSRPDHPGRIFGSPLRARRGRNGPRGRTRFGQFPVLHHVRSDGDFLNGQYTVFGRVIEGMEVVDAIKRGAGQNGAVVGQPDTMATVRVVD